MGEGYHGYIKGEGRASSEDKLAMAQPLVRKGNDILSIQNQKLCQVVYEDQMDVEDATGQAVSPNIYHDKRDRMEVGNETGKA